LFALALAKYIEIFSGTRFKISFTFSFCVSINNKIYLSPNCCTFWGNWIFFLTSSRPNSLFQLYVFLLNFE
jgi:hypothetical protein